MTTISESISNITPNPTDVYVYVSATESEFEFEPVSKYEPEPEPEPDFVSTHTEFITKTSSCLAKFEKNYKIFEEATVRATKSVSDSNDITANKFQTAIMGIQTCLSFSFAASSVVDANSACRSFVISDNDNDIFNYSGSRSVSDYDPIVCAINTAKILTEIANSSQTNVILVSSLLEQAEAHFFAAKAIYEHVCILHAKAIDANKEANSKAICANKEAERLKIYTPSAPPISFIPPIHSHE